MKSKRILHIFNPPFFAFFLLVIIVMIAFPKTRTLESFISGTIFCVVLLMVSLLFDFIFSRKAINKKQMIIMTIFLSIVDLLIKVLVIFVLKDSSVSVIKNLIHIDLIKNPYQTLIYQAADKIASSYMVGSLKLLIPVFFILILRFYKKKYNMQFDSYYAKMGIIFILSACICTVLDSFIWGYTPDYILLVPLYSAIDLKDVFAFFGVGFLIPEFLINQKNKY